MDSNNKIFILVLACLYFIQGIPFGIQDKFIPVHLHLQNVTFSNVSFMKCLLIPWIFKGIWAPFIQIYFGPYFWLLFTVAGMCASSLWCSFISPDDVFEIAFVLFIFNFMSALQDVVVDGLALNVLKERQLGFGNTVQVVLYKVGSLFGGAGLIFLTNYSSWPSSFSSVALLYLACVTILYFSKSYFDNLWIKDLKDDRKSQEIVITKAKNTKSKVSRVNKRSSSISNIAKIFREVWTNETLLQMVAYISVYKMGERAAVNNFPLYLLDKGVSSNQLAFWSGVVCQCVSIVGSMIGGIKLSHELRAGYLLKRYLIHRSIVIFMFFLVIMVWGVQPLTSYLGSLYYYVGLSGLVYLNYVSGVITTASFTMMMQQSRRLSRESQATHFSSLASIEVAGKLAFASVAGLIIDSVGIRLAFFIFTAISIAPCFLL